MTAPDFMPVLSAGAHATPKDGMCLLECASLLAGEPFGMGPDCVSKSLCPWAWEANDSSEGAERQELLSLLPRLMGTTDEVDSFAIYLAAETSYVERAGSDAGDCARAALIAALDEYDRQTGRTEADYATITPEQFQALAELTA